MTSSNAMKQFCIAFQKQILIEAEKKRGPAWLQLSSQKQVQVQRIWHVIGLLPKHWQFLPKFWQDNIDLSC